jgi:hypothetical protein
MFRESRESRNIPSSGDYEGRGPVVIKRISWGAIIAGVVVALVFQMVFSLLGLGIGIGAINPMEANPMEGLGAGAVIWWGASMLISLFLGGYVAGRLAGMPRNEEGIAHGVLTWSVFTLFSFFLLTTTIGGAFNVIGNTLSKSLSIAGQQNINPTEVKEKLSQELEQRGITKEGIQEQVQNPENRQKAEEMSTVASKAGIFGAIGLILGGIVAALGGLTGRPKHLLEDVKVPVKERVYVTHK